MPTALIVDDQFTSREIMREVVHSAETGMTVASFTSPVEALKWATIHPVDLVLTDYKMPHMDGVEFVRLLRRIPACSDIPVVVITVVEDKSIRYQALEVGATDFLTKPIDHHECRARCRNLLRLRQQQQIIKDRARWLERQVQDVADKIHVREKETLRRLARVGGYRETGSEATVRRIARYARLMAETLGLSEDECDFIEQAAPMHDIGKVGISDAILLKPGALTDAERAVVNTHTAIGYEILRDSPSKYLQLGAVIALRHHEHYDGNGYPDGLKGEAIPIEARIVAVADVYDALVSERPYKQAWSMQAAIDYLNNSKGKQFDPRCVEAFLAQVDQLVGGQCPSHQPKAAALQ